MYLRSKFSLANSGRRSGTVSLELVTFKWDMNSLVISSVCDRNCFTWLGELSPFWSSDLKRHHSSPFLKSSRSFCIKSQNAAKHMSKHTLEVARQFCKYVVDPFDISPVPNGFSAADTFQVPHYSLLLKCHGDRKAIQHQLLAPFSLWQWSPIFHTFQIRPCGSRSNRISL